MGFLVLAALLALLAPWLPIADPYALNDALLSPPSAEHLLGTDQIGRDLFARVIYGARLSGRVALLSVGLAMTVGTALGLIAGAYPHALKGWLDTLISRSLDVLLSLPEVLLALVIVAVLGVGLNQITLAIAVVYTPIFARVARSAAQRAIQQPYVEAARALGVGPLRLLVRHVLPNCLPPIITQATLSLAFALLAEAALSYLGLSGEPDAPSWGQMLRQSTSVLELAWWPAVFPGLCICASVLSLNLVGDAIGPRR